MNSEMILKSPAFECVNLIGFFKNSAAVYSTDKIPIGKVELNAKDEMELN